MNRRQFLWTGALAGAFRAAAQEPSDNQWAFNPAKDDFSPAALLDLRYLNEKEAGQSGFVSVDKQGHFVLGDGRPARFWAVNTTVGRQKPYVVRPQWRKTEPDLEHHARFLAKRGVNMVRCHAFLNPDINAKPTPALTDIHPGERDWIWRTVAAMKKEGIYTTISPYFPLQMKFHADWNVPGGATQNPHGMLFLEPVVQDAYRSWLRHLYAEVNPYTGTPLAHDPAVAVIQLQNEDSLFFWTFSNITGVQKDNLRRYFGYWAAEKYGSTAAAREAWGASMAADDVEAGVLDVYPIYDLTQPQRGGKALRMAAQVQFMADAMQRLYFNLEYYLRNELGCKQLINAGNWKTGDPVRLNDLERWTYSINQVSAVNRYYTGLHQGDSRYQSWAVVEGDKFTDPSVLKNFADFPLNVKQTEGMPMILTEGLWVQPHRYLAEAPFLISAYQSLTGIQAYYWFSTAEDEWAPPQSANGYLTSLAKFEFARPDLLGLFPAAALLYRRGYVKEGAPVVREVRGLQSLWERRTPLIAENPTYDPNRDSGDMAPESTIRTGVSPRAFLAGPVRVKFGGSESESTVQDIPGDTSSVRSNTGELSIDASAGVCIVDAPKAQGVCAFFPEGGGEFRLSAVTIRCRNEYASITVVAMDDQPLEASQRVLIQVGTQAFPAGWQTEPVEMTAADGRKFDGVKIAALGKAPWRIVRAHGDVEIRNRRLNRARVLSPTGIVQAEAKIDLVSGGIRVALPEDALYLVLDVAA